MTDPEFLKDMNDLEQDLLKKFGDKDFSSADKDFSSADKDESKPKPNIKLKIKDQVPKDQVPEETIKDTIKKKLQDLTGGKRITSNSNGNLKIEDEIPSPLPHGKKPKKQELIAKIMMFEENFEYVLKDSDYERLPPSNYQKMKLAELQERLAKLTNIGGNHLLGTETKSDDKIVNGVNVDQVKRAFNVNVEKHLFNIHLLLVQFIEMSTLRLENTRLKTNLYGLSDDVLENREALQEALRDIYMENEEWLKFWLTATNRYVFLMLTMSGKRMMENRDKKKNGELLHPPPESD